MTTSREHVLVVAQQQLNLDAGASMAALATAAGVSRATMHRHFDSRDALLVELGTRSLDRWEQRMDGVGLERVVTTADPDEVVAVLRELVLGYVADSDDFGFALTDHVILANDELVERTERLADREATLFAAAQAAGVLVRGLPPRWFGHVTYGLLVAGREAVRVGDVARRDVPDLVLSALLTGITPHPDQNETNP